MAATGSTKWIMFDVQNQTESKSLNWKWEFKYDAHLNAVMIQPQINVLSMSGFSAR